MKTILLLLSSFTLFNSFAQSTTTRQQVGTVGVIAPGPNRSQMDADTIAASAAARQQSDLFNRDPWRIINGQTNHTSAAWSQFSGRVIRVQNKGYLIHGYCWLAGTLPGKTTATDFFLTNCPYAFADGDEVGIDYGLLAVPSGTYSYRPPSSSETRTVHKLDYGIVTTAPRPKSLTPEQIEKNKAEQSARTLQYHQKLAADGDSFGLFRMGERYLKGDGVETNLVQAKIYLARAANAGNAEAKSLLEKLP